MGLRLISLELLALLRSLHEDITFESEHFTAAYRRIDGDFYGSTTG
jgi:hypothetical protein